MTKRNLVSAFVVLALVSGCGVFRQDWTIAKQYCATGSHFKIDDPIDTSWWSKTIKVPGSLTIERVDLNDNVVWATATFPGSNHTECLKLQRADAILNQRGIEIFLRTKGGDDKCEDLITEAFIVAVRNHAPDQPGCLFTHSGGWKAL